jgi:hypothetical protein
MAAAIVPVYGTPNAGSATTLFPSAAPHPLLRQLPFWSSSLFIVAG